MTTYYFLRFSPIDQTLLFSSYESVMEASLNFLSELTYVSLYSVGLRHCLHTLIYFCVKCGKHVCLRYELLLGQSALKGSCLCLQGYTGL